MLVWKVVFLICGIYDYKGLLGVMKFDDFKLYINDLILDVGCKLLKFGLKFEVVG